MKNNVFYSEVEVGKKITQVFLKFLFGVTRMALEARKPH